MEDFRKGMTNSLRKRGGVHLCRKEVDLLKVTDVLKKTVEFEIPLASGVARSARQDTICPATRHLGRNPGRTHGTFWGRMPARRAGQDIDFLENY